MVIRCLRDDLRALHPILVFVAVAANAHCGWSSTTTSASDAASERSTPRDAARDEEGAEDTMVHTRDGPGEASGNDLDSVCQPYVERALQSHAFPATTPRTMSTAWGIALEASDSRFLFFAGAFEGTVAFGGPAVTGEDNRFHGVVVAYEAPSGAHLWTQCVGEVGHGMVRGLAIKPPDRLVIAGYDPSGAHISALSTSDGSPVWTQSVTTRSKIGNQLAVAHQVAVDRQGNAVAVGWFRGQADLGGERFRSHGDIDAFVAKLSGIDGRVMWVAPFGGPGQDRVHAVEVGANGEIYVAGGFAETIVIGDRTHSARGGLDVFAAKLAARDGAPLWSTAWGGFANERAHDIALAPNDTVAVVGVSRGGLWTCADTYHQSNGNADGFVAVLRAADGSCVWSKTVGGKMDDLISGVAALGADQLVLVGSFSGAVDFAGERIWSAGSDDIFVVSYSLAGDHVWSTRFGGAARDAASAVAVDAAESIYLTGTFRDRAAFGSRTLQATNLADHAFIVRMKGCPP